MRIFNKHKQKVLVYYYKCRWNHIQRGLTKQRLCWSTETNYRNALGHFNYIAVGKTLFIHSSNKNNSDKATLAIIIIGNELNI